MIELHLKNVTKLFGDVKAIDDVTLTVKAGELFFLLGPSGCGKTTCLRVIAGFYRPDRGEVWFGDKLMNDVPPYKRNIGMVFQNYALWPHMTVYENIEYGLNVRKVPAVEKKQKVERVLEIVRMEGYSDRTPNQLSGGQQQRVALARALVVEPDILLLDEPLSNLDAKLRLEMRQEIKRIHKEAGITSIYVTHDQKEALSLADRIAVMNDGKVIQIGTPREIYNQPINTFVADFIGETNFIKGKVKKVESGTFVIDSNIGDILSKSGRDMVVTGSEGFCSVRPESIKIYDSPQPNVVNQFESRIISITYLGDVEEYWLNIRNTVDLKVINYNPGQHVRNLGDKVYISFDPADAIFLSN